MSNRPFRSVLYLPASNVRALQKARTLPVDALILDLEDAVAPHDKVAARETLAEALREGGFGDRYISVRINGFDTPWGEDDLSALAPLAPDAVLLPKVNRWSDIESTANRLDAFASAKDTAIWAMIETPEGVLNAAEIARAPRMAGFVLGTNDLAKDLTSRSREALRTALQMTLLAARAARIICVDGVYNAFRDVDGLKAECEEGRDYGFHGKSLIHPLQIETANTVFAPSEAEIDLARRQIQAFDEALAEGSGLAVLDGSIVENLHVETARMTLAQAEIIAQRAEG